MGRTGSLTAGHARCRRLRKFPRARHARVRTRSAVRQWSRKFRRGASRVAAHHQERHEVFEHRAGPGEQRPSAVDFRQRAAHAEPMLLGDVAFGDADKTRQPRLAGEQVVIGVVGFRCGDVVADREDFRSTSNRNEKSISSMSWSHVRAMRLSRDSRSFEPRAACSSAFVSCCESCASCGESCSWNAESWTSALSQSCGASAAPALPAKA